MKLNSYKTLFGRKLTAISACILVSGAVYSQSDNPCGAPSLTTSASCSYQAANLPASYTGSAVPAPSCAYYNNGRDTWYTVTVPPSGAFSVDLNTSGSGPTDMGMAFYTAPSCAGPFSMLECDDDDSPNGLMPYISRTGLPPGSTIYVRIWSYGGSATGPFRVCAVAAPTPPTNITCAQQQPICSGSAINFTASNSGTSAEPGNNYGCLYTYPNPSWYYMEIANPGNLAINISAASDIDFALWGPYANLAAAQASCTSYPAPLDCSYSYVSTEQANIIGAQTGQVYVLLVTNYANTIQTITVNPAGGSTATTNCAIVPLGVELLGFHGEINANEQVDLRWSTSSEVNNESFAIQRSKEGEFWETIGAKKGNGTTQQVSTYSFTDTKPHLGTSYYRLVQKDTDGKTSFSNVVSIGDNDSWNFTMYPVPARDEVSLVGVEGKIESIYAMTNLGTKQAMKWINTNGSYTVDCKSLAKGSYLLQVSTTSGVQTRKLIID